MTDDAADLTTWTLGSVKASGMELEGGCKRRAQRVRALRRRRPDQRFGADWLVPKSSPCAVRRAASGCISSSPSCTPTRRVEQLAESAPPTPNARREPAGRRWSQLEMDPGA